MAIIKFKKLRFDAKSPDSLGNKFDIHVVETYTINYLTPILIKTGLYLEMSNDYKLHIDMDRIIVEKYGLTFFENTYGLENNKGELCFVVLKLRQGSCTINKNTKLASAFIFKLEKIKFMEEDPLLEIIQKEK